MAFFSNSQISGIEGGIGLVGLAGGIAGALETSAGAKQKAEAQKAIFQLEQQADAQRRNAMEIAARRQQLQTVRTAQTARAAALSAAVGQGAQFSSSAQGGQQGVTSQGNYANLGVSQNLLTGEKLFDINSEIGGAKLTEANAETKMAEGSGISSLFGSLGKSAGAFGNLLSLIPGA